MCKAKLLLSVLSLVVSPKSVESRAEGGRCRGEYTFTVVLVTNKYFVEKSPLGFINVFLHATPSTIDPASITNTAISVELPFHCVTSIRVDHQTCFHTICL